MNHTNLNLPVSEEDIRKDLLKAEAWKISEILIEAQESLKILEYLMKDDPEVDTYSKHLDYFWRFTTSVYSDQVLLKLNILFTPKEHFSIDRLLKKLMATGEFSGVIADEKINQWNEEIKRMKAICKKISAQRNKRIAHRDRTAIKKTQADISLSELKSIVYFVQEIVKEIYSSAAQAAFQVDSPIGSPVDSLRCILKVLNENRKQELKPLMDEAKKYGITEGFSNRK